MVTKHSRCMSARHVTYTRWLQRAKCKLGSVSPSKEGPMVYILIDGAYHISAYIVRLQQNEEIKIDYMDIINS